jgi:hypothetical protein
MTRSKILSPLFTASAILAISDAKASLLAVIFSSPGCQ